MLAAYPAVALGAAAVRATLGRAAELRPGYIAMGNVVQAGNGQNPARAAAIRGGVERTTPGITLNDVCLAGMTSVAIAAQMVRAGEIPAAVVGGFESMSRAPRAVGPGLAPGPDPGEPVDLLQHDGLWCALDDVGMGPLSDAANARLGIRREDQDRFALESHLRAAHATRSGRLGQEIDVSALAVETRDEGIRETATFDRLRRLKPAFTPDGTITAGNASQLSDAAAAGVVCAIDMCRPAGMTPMAAIEGRALVAGPDSSLHLKPALAARALLARHGLTVSQIDLWEINEAFAGVALATMRELGIDHSRVNVNGGAIALGHPLGASGFRLILTLASEMRLRGAELGVAAICGGGGQGQAMLLRLV
jgi:acetyl-CoA C-acetyltransferase